MLADLLASIKKWLGLTDRGEEKIKRPVLKKLNFLIILAVGGIFLIVLANTFAGSGSTSADRLNTGPPAVHVEPPTLKNTSSEITKLENTLAERLEEVLAQVNGVGQVQVTVNLASTTQKDYAINTTTNNKNTQERDPKGGNRTITETNENGQMVMARGNQGGGEAPVVVKEIKPEVKGVIVVAEGADDMLVKADLMKAVQVYLDLPLYKVIVLPKEGR